MKQGWSSFMDRRVKERLVGATILVALIVLIVPELLSGPKRRVAAPPPVAAGPEEPVRNVTVDLATSKATPEAESAAASAAAPAPAETPSAAAGSTSVEEGRAGPEHAASDEPGSSPGATRPRVASPPTVTTLRAQPAAPPMLENEVSPPRSAAANMSRSGAGREPAPAAVSHHGWAVQLGSFASRANAETLVHRLKAQDSSAYVSSSGKGAALRYRVRIGPLADRGSAERVQLKLMKEGHPASLVPP
jgi:DedD protein